MGTGMLHSLYGVLSTTISPVVAAGLGASARGRRRFGERVGGWGKIPPVEWWLHGASVGEVQGLIPLIDVIRSNEKQSEILLTSSSPTGLDRVVEGVAHKRIQPIDAGWAVRRALSGVTARRLVIAETELWPNLLQEALKRRIACYIINGRISDYTFEWYLRLQRLFAPLLNQFMSICVTDDVQRDRYVALGVRAELVQVTGHTKYDIEPRFNGDHAKKIAGGSPFWSQGSPAPVVVLGSLRPGEENYWLGAVSAVVRQQGALRLILAPRHMERVEYFAERLTAAGIPFSRWSQTRGSSQREEVILLDVLGMLEQAYAVADLAFVGGTLVDIGGHNPLEPAMYGVPVVVGPYTSVIRDVIGGMQKLSGVLEVRTEGEVSALIARVMGRDPELALVGRRGESVWRSHRGAVKRVMAVVENGAN